MFPLRDGTETCDHLPDLFVSHSHATAMPVVTGKEMEVYLVALLVSFSVVNVYTLPFTHTYIRSIHTLM